VGETHFLLQSPKFILIFKKGFSGILMDRPKELSISDSLGRTCRKILKGQSKPYIVHLMDIALIVYCNV